MNAGKGTLTKSRQNGKQAKKPRAPKMASPGLAKRKAKIVPGDIELFENDDFNTKEDGWTFRTGLDCIDLGDYNDDASSIIIYSGTWEFYEHIEFNLNGTAQGYTVRLGPGYYGSLNAVGIANDTLSSFRQVG